MAGFITMLIIFGLMVLLPMVRQAKGGELKGIKDLFKGVRPALWTIIAVMVVVPVLVVNFNGGPKLSSNEEKIDFGLRYGNEELVQEGYFLQLKLDPLNLDLNFDFLESITEELSFSEVNLEGMRFDLNNVKFNTLYKRYQVLHLSSDPMEKDIGSLLLAMIANKTQNHKKLKSYLHQVSNTRLKYYNYLNGLLHKRDIQISTEYFNKEIALAGYIKGAAHALSSLHYYDRNADGIAALLDNDELAEFVPVHIAQQHYFNQGQFGRYMITVIKKKTDRINLFGFIGAFVVMLAWLLYVRSLDIYEPEKWHHVILILVLGIIFTNGVYPISDFLGNQLGIGLDGNPLNDFLYCVIGIGAVEELVKIIPVLLFLAFSKSINEPYDYILYGSVASLGFSFYENLGYYQESQLFVIHARAITATVAHMFFTSLITYGMLVNKHRYKRNPVLNFLLFYLLASIGHGFYDFWLINDYASLFNVLTLVFFLISLHLWTVFKNNAINNSNFFDYSTRINNSSIQFKLAIWLVGILMFEYTILGFIYGSEFAWANLIEGSLFTGYLIIYLTANFSRYEIIKGYWAPVRFPRNFTMPRPVKPQNLVGSVFRIKRTPFNRKIQGPAATTGEVVQRRVISGDTSWFLIKLVDPAFTRLKSFKHVLVRAAHSDEYLSPGPTEILALGVTDVESIGEGELVQGEFVFLGKFVAKQQES